LAIRADAPIGIFDSGVGGLTVASAVTQAFPKERIIYFGDTEHMPYGEKSRQSILDYSLAIARFLDAKGAKLIIIACNSASSYAYEGLKERYQDRLEIINVVDPVIQGSQQNPAIHKIGIIGTKATIRSKVYVDKLKAANASLEVFDQATPLLAPMVEEKYFNDAISQTVVANYLSQGNIPLDIDAMVLACTHYPLLKEDIRQFYQNKVQVLDSTDFVVEELQKKLHSLNLMSPSRNDNHEFYVSEYTDSFKEIARIFFTEEIDLIHYPIWN
jgi:glutamate racemase